MQFKSKQGQILDVTVQTNGELQMVSEQQKFFATFHPENAQAVKKFLNVNLPEEVENPDVNLNPSKGNVADGDEEMSQDFQNTSIPGPDGVPTEEGVKNV